MPSQRSERLSRVRVYLNDDEPELGPCQLEQLVGNGAVGEGPVASAGTGRAEQGVRGFGQRWVMCRAITDAVEPSLEEPRGPWVRHFSVGIAGTGGSRHAKSRRSRVEAVCKLQVGAEADGCQTPASDVCGRHEGQAGQRFQERNDGCSAT